MSRFHSYLSSALQIINSYDGKGPLVFKLKEFFASDKKFGSRDRRTISAMCYSFFRTGRAFTESGQKEKLIRSLYLCEPALFEQLPDMSEEWLQSAKEPVDRKIEIAELYTGQLFPFHDFISPKIRKDDFIISFLLQPDLFLRIRPGKNDNVIRLLNDKDVSFIIEGHDCIRLNNSFNASAILRINRDVVIQDMNSQRVLENLENYIPGNTVPDAWDCCAASGGKSILLYDRLKGNVRLTVSDIRESILVNLRNRLKDAGINIMKSFVANLRERATTEPGRFNIVMCDVPCSGSGTWGRTPEQLFFFDTKKIDEYATLQKQITINAHQGLMPGGIFIYITCSVFKKENEEVVEMLLAETSLSLLDMKYLEGYSSKADTMFVAMFRLP